MIIYFEELPDSAKNKVVFTSSRCVHKKLEFLGFTDPRKLTQFEELVKLDCLRKTFVKDGRGYFEITVIAKVK